MEINLENVVDVMFDKFLNVETEGFEADEIEEGIEKDKKAVLEMVNLMDEETCEKIIAEKLANDLVEVINLIEEVLEDD